MYWISIKALRNKCQNSNYGYVVYPLMFRFFRVVSIYFTWLLIQTKCKPNTITIYGVLFGVLSGVMFVFNQVEIAFVLVVLAIVLDFSDGEVSRFHGTSSKEGTYLDVIHHFIVPPFFIAGVVLWAFQKSQNFFFLSVGILSVINSIILIIAISSAVDIAVLKHLLRHIKKNNIMYKTEENINDKNNPIKIIDYIKAVPGAISRLLDFPYNIIIISTSVVIENYFNKIVFNFKGALIEYTIYLFAFLSSAMICLFIWHVVNSKHIDKKLSEITK